MTYIPVFISFLFGWFYLGQQTLSIYAGDSGELVTAASTWSIAHPPGYPLYVLIGNILSHYLPFFTPAWRVGLLSSIPMAIAIYFLWKSIYAITKSPLASSIGSCIFGLFYPVWLYAIVPEVFGLFAFFSSVTLYTFLRFIETKRVRYLYILAFIMGVSMTHHHLSVLLNGAILISLLVQYRAIVKKSFSFSKAFIAGIVGFSFYLYAPIASSFYPPLDWEHPASIHGFFRLVSRAAYGTFKATSGEGPLIFNRWLNVMTFFEYLWRDALFIGCITLAIGYLYVYRKNRKLFLFLSLYSGLQIFYFFYAGFTLATDFSLGTLERFFIVPYQLVALMIGIGIWGSIDMLHMVWDKNKKTVHIPFPFIVILVSALVSTIPLASFKKYYKPMSLLKSDMTMERLADDIFKSAPQGSILSLTDDTSIFASMYGYFVQKKRQDLRFILFSRLQNPEYPRWIKTRYKDVAIPPTAKPMTYKDYLTAFLQANFPLHPILHERTDTMVTQYWIPRGLLMMYYPTLEDIPTRMSTLEKNKEIWTTFQNPLQGVLGTYRHLMMADVLRYYAQKRLTLAQAQILLEQQEDAKRSIDQVISYIPDVFELYLPYLSLLIDKKECGAAVDILTRVKNKYTDEKTYLLKFHEVYEVCPAMREFVSSGEASYQVFMKKHGEKIE